MRPRSPAVSVIVACTRPQLIEGIARRLGADPDAPIAELVVAGDVKDLDPATWPVPTTLIECASRHPNVRRGLGLAASSAPVVAFIDDDAVPEPGWVSEAATLGVDALEVWTGPEEPTRTSRAARVAHAVSANGAEGHLAHVDPRPRPVRWSDVPFCNLVTSRSVVQRIGPPPVDIPWDMDDFAWCRRAADAGVAFHNRPLLRIRHDRYPDRLRDWLRDRAHDRSRTGVKLVRYPSTYLRIPAVVAAALAPVAALGTVVLVTWLGHPKVIGLVGLLYLSALVLTAARSRVPVAWKPLVATSTCLLHVITVGAVQLGIVRGAIAAARRRPDPMLLVDAPPTEATTVR